MYDRLEYNGSEYHLAGAPLEAYFAEHKGRRPAFTSFSTGCVRGYIASWRISDKKLYLVDMEMVLETDATFETLFPGTPSGGIFADWASGVYVCPHGEIIGRDHARFMPVYEAELTITVENGVVISAEEKRNESNG